MGIILEITNMRNNCVQSIIDLAYFFLYNKTNRNNKQDINLQDNEIIINYCTLRHHSYNIQN